MQILQQENLYSSCRYESMNVKLPTTTCCRGSVREAIASETVRKQNKVQEETTKQISLEKRKQLKFNPYLHISKILNRDLNEFVDKLDLRNLERKG